MSEKTAKNITQEHGVVRAESQAIGCFYFRIFEQKFNARISIYHNASAKTVRTSVPKIEIDASLVTLTGVRALPGVLIGALVGSFIGVLLGALVGGLIGVAVGGTGHVIEALQAYEVTSVSKLNVALYE